MTGWRNTTEYCRTPQDTIEYRRIPAVRIAQITLAALAAVIHTALAAVILLIDK